MPRAVEREAWLQSVRLVVARLRAIVADRNDADDIQEVGRIDGLRSLADRLEHALELAPVRAVAAIERVRRECQRTVRALEREAEQGLECGTPYDWGGFQAEFDLVAMLPGRIIRSK